MDVHSIDDYHHFYSWNSRLANHTSGAAELMGIPCNIVRIQTRDGFNRARAISWFVPFVVMALAGCGDSGPTVDEAYRVGYDIGLSDECGRHGVRTEPMPSAYDDSLSEGKLASAFQDGYWTARNESRPCKYD
jgi:hypothetical protein